VDKTSKLVIAIVKPGVSEETLDALARFGIQDVICSEVKDYSQKGPTEFYRGAQYTTKFLPMVKIEAIVQSEHVAKITSAITRAAHSARVTVLDIARQRTEKVEEIAPPRAA
jgi:nitrogen regulatory protein PII